MAPNYQRGFRDHRPEGHELVGQEECYMRKKKKKLSITVKALRCFLPTLQVNKLTCHMDAGRTQETSASETKDFFIHSNSSKSMDIFLW